MLEGAREHNLQDITVEFPLGAWSCVTGVSGSGKSTLMHDVLYPALMRHFGKATDSPGASDRLLGADWIGDAVFVDQTPIGKTARSNPASYVGAFDEIRKLFAQTPLARERGYGAGMFSFNAGDGRCPTCGGEGFEHVEMQFLSDVYLRCPDCDGRRFRPSCSRSRSIAAAGDVTRDLSVADVLELTVSEAVQLFSRRPRGAARAAAARRRRPRLPEARPAGADALGRRGAAAEARRLPRRGGAGTTASRQPVAQQGTLYMFDEPTTGLHFDDVAKLMRAFRKLLDAGHSLIVDRAQPRRDPRGRLADRPRPRRRRGRRPARRCGTPEEVRRHPTSHTGRALRDYERALGRDGHAVEEGRPLAYVVKLARGPARARSTRRSASSTRASTT